MKDKLKILMSDVFKVDLCEITEDISQGTFEKWDSLHHLNLIVVLEEEFDLFFDPEEISGMTSFNAVLEIIKRKND